MELAPSTARALPQHRANADDDQIDDSDYDRYLDQQDCQADQKPKDAKRDTGGREHQRHADRQHKQGQQNHSYHSQNIRRFFHSLNLFRALAAYLLPVRVDIRARPRVRSVKARAGLRPPLKERIHSSENVEQAASLFWGSLFRAWNRLAACSTLNKKRPP